MKQTNEQQTKLSPMKIREMTEPEQIANRANEIMEGLDENPSQEVKKMEKRLLEIFHLTYNTEQVATKSSESFKEIMRIRKRLLELSKFTMDYEITDEAPATPDDHKEFSVCMKTIIQELSNGKMENAKAEELMRIANLIMKTWIFPIKQKLVKENREKLIN